ncbi:hypothetical protein L2K70_07030 [Nocardioides KLBMP 9356]|uniref:DUF2567 domain-containing protein n=1 Tax=Nocardioides potassii TaxID=2911371 RepID=A0ABS9HAI7_9ACTN|nr:hypothetical protein [Nocardioides potassii]MCF6377353.1 hypothetical protein [Nocardioides potassii]
MSVRHLATIVVGFLVAGAGGGLLWERLSDPTAGLTYQDQWYVEPAGPDVAFQSVAMFVLVAFPIGLVLAVLAGLWRDGETATVVTVLVAATAAGLVMYAVGSSLGPPDPQALAAGSPDYTPLPGHLGLTAPDRGRTPWMSTALVAFPAGAMTGLVGMYLFGAEGLARRSRG